MAIEIIDGFKVSSAVPVDNRIVASGSNSRSAIAYKYEGLRVFDTYDSTPYVWLNNSWKKENQTALSAATVAPLGFSSTTSYRVGQILKVYDSANTLTNSNIFEKLTLNVNGGVTNRAIAINHIDGSGNNTPNTVSNTVQLDVKGVIKATSFEGIGANITDISPLNLNTSTNKIKINQIEPGTNGYFLGTTTDNTGSTILQWVNLTAGFSPSTLLSTIDAASVQVKYLTFIEPIGGNIFRHYSNANYLIGVIPNKGQIVVRNSVGADPSAPPYSFIDDQDTGIYNSAVGSVGISSNGSKKVEIDTNGIKIVQGNAANPGISFIGANNYGIYQTTTGNNRIGVVVAGAEVLRIKSTGNGTQGNGNTAIYGEGGLLSLIGNTHAFMEFYRTGSATPDAANVVTPSGTNRGAYIGYPSGSTNFEIKNTSTTAYISLLSNGDISLIPNGVINLNPKVNSGHGVIIENSGTNPSGLWIKNVGAGGDSLKITGGVNRNVITLFSSTTRTSFMGHTASFGGDKQLTIASDNDSAALFPGGGTLRPFVGMTYNNGNLSTNSGYDGGRVGILVGGLKIMEVNRGGVAMWSEYCWIANRFDSAGGSYYYAVGTTLYFSGLNSNNNQTSTSSSGFLAAEPFDRLFHVSHSSAGAAHCFIEVEWGVNNPSGQTVPAGVGGGKAYMNMIARSASNGYSTCTALVPKGRRFRIGYDINSVPAAGTSGYVSVFGYMANYSSTSIGYV